MPLESNEASRSKLSRLLPALLFYTINFSATPHAIRYIPQK